jgi:hypothetical protein
MRDPAKFWWTTHLVLLCVTVTCPLWLTLIALRFQFFHPALWLVAIPLFIAIVWTGINVEATL